MANESRDQNRPARPLRKQGEEAVGRFAQEVLQNPIVTGALTTVFETRERATRAQEVAMNALNLPSAADIERLTRRVRSVAQRIEGLEDGIDRLGDKLEDGATGTVDARLAALEEKLDARFAAFEEKLDARFAAFEATLEARFSGLEDTLARVQALLETSAADTPIGEAAAPASEPEAAPESEPEAEADPAPAAPEPYEDPDVDEVSAAAEPESGDAEPES